MVILFSKLMLNVVVLLLLVLVFVCIFCLLRIVGNVVVCIGVILVQLSLLRLDNCLVGSVREEKEVVFMVVIFIIGWNGSDGLKVSVRFCCDNIRDRVIVGIILY